jgi:hypothetical protein
MTGFAFVTVIAGQGNSWLTEIIRFLMSETIESIAGFCCSDSCHFLFEADTTHKSENKL